MPVTVLRALSGVITKTVTINRGPPVEYRIAVTNPPLRFSASSHPANSIQELSALLTILQGDLKSAIIRGALIPDVDSNDVFRRKYGSYGNDGVFVDCPRNWVCLDVDKLATSALTPGLSHHAAIVKLLPAPFARASYHWKYSSSQFFKGDATVSMHLWFMLDSEVDGAQLKAYFEHFNTSFKELYGVDRLVDIVLFDHIQLHYTSDPVIVGDPALVPLAYLAARAGLVSGLEPAVTLTREWITDGVDSKLERHLGRLGDDKDGFHAPLLSASVLWIRLHGTDGWDQFKLIVKDAIQAANKDGHSFEQIERYQSDSYLSQLLKGAAQKFKGEVRQDAKKFVSEYVFDTENDKFLYIKAGSFISKGAFATSSTTFFPAGQADKVFKRAGGIEVHGVRVIPGEPAGVVEMAGVRHYNKWEPRHATRLETYDVSLWEEHIEYLCEDKEIATTMKDFFAFIIAKPGKKINWALLLGSKEQGVGKSILKGPMSRIIGLANTQDMSGDMLTSQFNGYAEKEMVFVEEVKHSDNAAVYNSLKEKITEKRVMINEKFQAARQVNNYANYVMFTNSDRALMLDEEDRRFFVVYNKSSKKPQSYYNTLCKWLENSDDVVFSWAMDRDLSAFNPAMAPMWTKAKGVMVSRSESRWVELIKTGLDRLSWPCQHDIVDMDELKRRVAVETKQIVKIDTFEEKLISLGISIRKIKMPAGHIAMVAVLRNPDQWTDDKIIEQLRNKAIGSQDDWLSIARH